MKEGVLKKAYKDTVLSDVPVCDSWLRIYAHGKFKLDRKHFAKYEHNCARIKFDNEEYDREFQELNRGVLPIDIWLQQTGAVEILARLYP